MSSTRSYYTQALHGLFGLVTEKFGLTELALVFGGSRRSMPTTFCARVGNGSMATWGGTLAAEVSAMPIETGLIFPPALCEDDALVNPGARLRVPS